MAYATQSDLENLFGVSNIARWSQLDNSSDPETEDAARIALAIANAEATIDDRFRGTQYAVPFVTVTAKITEWAVRLAGVWLYTSRGVNSRQGANEADQRILYHQKLAMEEMDLYAAGTRRFPATVGLVGRGGTAPFVVAKAGGA